MSEIQVDMFEVQLGAALLLQFKTNVGKTVRVLADAGVTAGGYQRNHVHKKLPGSFTAFGGSTQRLDLIIGTHYDADHLEGLVPIIDDNSIDIGEAWMPPVANDTEMHAMEENIQNRHLLGRQLAGEEGDRVLKAYLGAKADVCEMLRDLGKMANNPELNIRNLAREGYPFSERWEGQVENIVNYFEGHIRDANETLGQTEHTHADEDVEAFPSAKANLERVKNPYFRDLSFLSVQPYWSDDRRLEFFQRTWSENRSAAKAQAHSIASLYSPCDRKRRHQRYIFRQSYKSP